MSLATQLTSFYSAMFNRMVGRASQNNPAGSNHIGSSPQDITNAGVGQSGNLGGGAIPIGNIAVYPDPNTIGYVQAGYSGNSTVYTIIRTIASKFAYLPRYVYEIKDQMAVKQYKHYIKAMDGKVKGHEKKIKELFKKAYQETVVDNKLSELLIRPNPNMGQDFFLQVVDAYYETAGEAIIWLNRGSDSEDLPNIEGPILEMWPLPPQYMEMVPDPFNVWGSLGWVFNVAGKRIPIDNENILHWRQANLNFDGVTREHMRGMSPLRPGAKKLTEDESATDASVALNQNEGAKGLLYDTSTTPMTPTRETNLRNAVDRKINQREMRGAVALMAGNFGYVDMSMSSTDLELETRKDNIFDRLCNLFGVPPDLFKTGQTYQNMIQARKDFITNKILPAACSFRDEYNRMVLPAFGLNSKVYTTDIDVSQITELQDDMTAQVTALAAAWWMTPNQRLMEMNLEESTEDGADNIWIPNTLVKIEDASMPAMLPDGFNDDGTPAGSSGTDSSDPDADDDQDQPAKPKPKNGSSGKNKGNS